MKLYGIIGGLFGIGILVYGGITLAQAQTENRRYHATEIQEQADHELRLAGIGKILEGMTFRDSTKEKGIPRLLRAYGARPALVREFPDISVWKGRSAIWIRIQGDAVPLRPQGHDGNVLPSVHLAAIDAAQRIYATRVAELAQKAGY